MNRYIKIRLDFKYGPKGRFYRIILVKEKIGLTELGIAMQISLGATQEHCFLFTTKMNESRYVCAAFMLDPLPGYKWMGHYSIDDLPEHFNFEYDTGDGWDFACKKYKRIVELDSDNSLIILDGAGQGIWEDNIGSLYALFDGEISPESTEEDEENGYYKPWNFCIKRFGEFDDPLDIEGMNEGLEEEYQETLNNYKDYEEEYISEYDTALMII